MSWRPAKLSEFLTEREGRIKYEDANRLGLQRIKKIDFSGNIHLDAETDTKTDMIQVKSGDLVISGINAAKGAIAVHAEDEDVLATIHYSAYEFNSDLISVDFLKWFFKSLKFSDLLRGQIPGGIKTELKPKHILPLQVRIPSLSEQIRLANRLNRFRLEQVKIKDEISQQRVLLAKLRQSILQEAIQGKLTLDWRSANQDAEPASKLLQRIQSEKARLIAAKKLRKESPLGQISPDEIPFEIPKGWEWCRLADIGYIGTGATPATENKAYYENGHIPWITSSATGMPFVRNAETFITDRAIAETNCTIYPKHTLLVAMYGQGKTRGQVTELLIEAATNQACAAIVIPDQFIQTNHFTKLVIQENYHRIRELAQGGSQPNLNLMKVKSSLVPFPPLAEQAVIVGRVEKLMATCRALETEVSRADSCAENLMQAVLSEAFSPAVT